jgi:hypothetical protein
MIQVDPRTRSSMLGPTAIILGAGWAAYGILGGGQVFLAIMAVLTILLGSGAAFFVRSRTSS